jgi:hypothetical protein
MKRLLFLVMLTLACGFAARAQKPQEPHYVPGMRVGNDTLPHVDLAPVWVFPKNKFRNKAEEQGYWTLVWRVKKVLPYAREAAVLLRKFETEVPPDARRKERRNYVKKAEDELMKKYGPSIKKMSISDGRILIKLIDRETNQVSYDIIHEIKGAVPAIFWQGVARLFGNNLKMHYDPIGEDRQIEQIVRFIDMGLI